MIGGRWWRRGAAGVPSPAGAVPAPAGDGSVVVLRLVFADFEAAQAFLDAAPPVAGRGLVGVSVYGRVGEAPP